MKYYIANWKMNMSENDATSWVKTWNKEGEISSKVVIAPSSIHIPIVRDLLTKDSSVELSAQDISVEEKGSHTGEIGAFQLKEMCKYAIVGHSERKEDYETVLKKIQTCLSNEIIPIVCFVNSDEVNKYCIDGVILAWEDPENISKEGVFNAKDPEDIKRTIVKMKSNLPTRVPILYGGSVNLQNIEELNKISKLDGVLIGSASLKAKDFYKICTQ